MPRRNANKFQGMIQQSLIPKLPEYERIRSYNQPRNGINPPQKKKNDDGEVIFVIGESVIGGDEVI